MAPARPHRRSIATVTTVATVAMVAARITIIVNVMTSVRAVYDIGSEHRYKRPTFGGPSNRGATL
jgi:hypothetical protein